MCVDQSELRLAGEYSSDEGSFVKVSLNACVGQAHCKSDQEIKDYLRGSYMLLLTNQMRFDSTRFGPDAIVRESRISWNRFSVITPQDQPFII